MRNTPTNEPAINTGIYSFSEAAWLLQITPRKISGWANGYRNIRNGDVRHSDPVIERTKEDARLLTFHELIELLFVKEYSNAGVNIKTIREAHEMLRQEWETPYPFALERLQSDGKQLLIKAKYGFNNVLDGQGVFEFVEGLFKNIDFDKVGLSERWWPLGRTKQILIDPTLSFGVPIDRKSRIRTRVLYSQFLAGDDVASIADWYEIDADQVRHAIEFEEKWAQNNKAA